MAYWWVSQNTNYSVVIEEGTLWTLPTRDGQLPLSRLLIKEMSIGDIVFHYRGPYLRAVSAVVESWVDSVRPTGYPPLDIDGPYLGWLVRVQPIQIGFELHRDRIGQLVPHGAPGPLDKNGEPQQKYISALSDAAGLALLDELQLVLPDARGQVIPSQPHEERRAGETDVQAMRSIRAEQGHLRKHLLGNKDEAACNICSRVLPVELLVAGHIKKRSESAEEERWDFESSAMLVCLLGCDTLFENGYIVVDSSGVIRRGRSSSSAALEVAVRARVGRICAAHNSRTAANFAYHAQIIAQPLSGASANTHA